MDASAPTDAAPSAGGDYRFGIRLPGPCARETVVFAI
jgi:hypothetical protein